MTRASGILASLAVAAVLITFAVPAAGQGVPPITVVHTAPVGATPGHQIYLSAILTNATSATIVWRNDTMTADAIVPMTNTSEANGTGWLFAAYLPAQPSPTQITYSIRASNAGGSQVESYFFSVDFPSTPGLTAADQEAWVWTMAATMAMIVSALAVLYWYVGRRLRREAV